MNIQTTGTAKLGRRIAQDYLTNNDLKEAPYDEVVGEVHKKLGGTVKLNNLKRDLVECKISPFEIIYQEGEEYIKPKDDQSLINTEKDYNYKMSRDTDKLTQQLTTIYRGTSLTVSKFAILALYLGAAQGCYYKSVLGTVKTVVDDNDIRGRGTVSIAVSKWFSTYIKEGKLFSEDCNNVNTTIGVKERFKYTELEFSNQTENKNYIIKTVTRLIKQLDLTEESHDLVYGNLEDYIEEDNPKLMEDVVNQSGLMEEIILMVKMGYKDKDYRRRLEREYRLTKNPVVKVLVEYGDELVKLDKEFQQSMVSDYQRELQEIQRQRSKLDALEQELNGRYSHVIGG